MAADLGNEASAAQKLLEKHSHQVTIEDVPDIEDVQHDAAVAAEATEEAGNGNGVGAGPAPSWAATPSAKAAGKQKATEPALQANIDTQSHEAFPELGPPKKVPATNVAPVWSAKNGNASNGNGASAASNGASRSSAPSTRAGTPASAAGTQASAAPSLSIPGRNVTSVYLDDAQILPRTALKRPIPDIIKDINRKSRANITMAPPTGGRRRFEATGPADAAHQALKDLVQQIGTKVTINVPIPQSVRPFIIGKQGATIKALQEKTGARIQLPKAEDVALAALDDDDEALIDVTVEGNTLSARAAHDAILKIVGERTANVNTRLRGIPAEFYPFIADQRNGLLPSLENSGVQVRVPPLQPWSAQPPTAPSPGARPVFMPAANDNHIQLAGDRLAVQNARTEIERLADQLRQQLQLEQTSIPRGRQQFIIGNHGTPMEDFFNETGCVIVLPTDEEDDNVAIVGPPSKINSGLERAIDLAMGMQCSNYDISRIHRQAAGVGATAHARNVTRYLRERKEIERLERLYQAHINTPFTSEGAQPWELYSRDGKNALRAQAEIKNIVASHPPTRMATMPVDPFYHQFLRNDVRPRLQESYGVHLVVPEPSEPGAPLLLVYEGPQPEDTPFAVPQSAPRAQDLALFQQGVRDAQNHILNLMKGQEEIDTIKVDVPVKFHDRLRRYIKELQKGQRADNQPPVRVSNAGVTVTLRGPKTAVHDLAAKVQAFVEQEKSDEKERGFTLTFDFPKAYANHLIGKGGSNIRDLRDKFDVEIQVQDGKVELKGPKAKAEAAKAHIGSMARQLADEVTHILKIESKFHRELIGAQGSTINRLQTRYKVLIFFPRVAKAARDDDSVTDVVSDAGKGRRQQAPDEVIIRGPKRGADEAREELMTLYLYLKENSFTATVSVQQKQVPYLIGQGGSAMDALRQQTGAKIDVPNSRGDPESVVEIQMKGTKTQVAAAKKILEEKKVILNDTVSRTIEVEKKYHRALIGTGGSNLRELVVKAGGSDDRRELSRTVQFPSQESSGSTIKVEGRKAVVDGIIAQIEAFVNERASQVSAVMDVPREKHRSLIGRGGETRRQIESQFSVTLDIPRQGDDRTEIKVTGLPANVDKAKAHMDGLLREQHSVTVQVPRRVHHAVSNNGQFFRRMRSENQVTIDHAGQTVPPRPTATAPAPVNGNGSLPLITDDEEASASAHSWKVLEAAADGSQEDGDIAWVLHGSPENVDKAQKALAKAVEQHLQQETQGSATGYLKLSDPRVYRHIVGAGGKTIESIRKKSGCRIHVPQGRTSGDPIEVVGSKEGVEVAKELILAAVAEGGKQRYEQRE